MNKARNNKKCPTCGKEFKARRSNQIYCNSKCTPGNQLERKIKSNLDHISPGTVGAIAELLVSIDLMKRGYTVYRALSPASYSDILAVKGSIILHVEVRTATYYLKEDGSRNLVYGKAKLGNKFLVIVTHSDNKIHYPCEPF